MYKIDPISYVQHGNIPIRDSARPHPTPCQGRRRWGWGWGEGHGGWGVGNPLWVYFHIGYRILDINFYMYMYT